MMGLNPWVVARLMWKSETAHSSGRLALLKPAASHGGHRRNANPWLTPVFLVLISLTFLLAGIGRMHQAVDPAYQDTGSFLEGALFIKEHGGIARFVTMSLNGEYKIANQHPLYLLILSTVASRDLSFFPMAKAITLAIALLFLLVLCVVVRDLYGRSTAYVATVLLAFNASLLNRATHVTVEPLLLLCVVAAWYFMVKGLEDHRQWAWAGLWSGLAYMSKATGIFLIPIFVIATFCFLRWRMLRNRYFWLFFLACGLASSPLILRNVRVYGEPVHETVNSGVPWMDSKVELSEKYALSVNWREQTYAGDNLPTMGSYLRSHSPSVIVVRLINGVKGEGKLLLQALSVSPLLGRISVGRVGRLSAAVGLLLFSLFVFGLVRDRASKGGLYTVVALPIFFFPFAWYYQITPSPRWIIPLVPLILVHASVGIVQLCKAVEQWLSATRFKLNVNNHVPAALCVMLIIAGGYLAATIKTRPLIHPVELTDDQRDLMQWLGRNVKDEDRVILRPTKRCKGTGACDSPYWGWLWYAGFKGTLVMTRWDVPIQADSLSGFRTYLTKRRVNMIVIHESNYASPKLLADYFKYDEREGLTQLRELEGWKLVYSYPGKPTKFLIYRIDITERSAANRPHQQNDNGSS
jgi:4-amino-4-deoxy-L-arabinose transferase-like glycosyltransferase